MTDELIEAVARALAVRSYIIRGYASERDAPDAFVTAEALADADGTDWVEAAQAALAVIEARGMLSQGWRDIESAPRDGTHILGLYRDEHGRRRIFEIWHEGVTRGGYDMGWALYPGYGGVPDRHFEGWMPLPAPPVAAAEETQNDA